MTKESNRSNFIQICELRGIGNRFGLFGKLGQLSLRIDALAGGVGLCEVDQVRFWRQAKSFAITLEGRQSRLSNSSAWPPSSRINLR